jgi:hypothetical protein
MKALQELTDEHNKLKEEFENFKNGELNVWKS